MKFLFTRNTSTAIINLLNNTSPITFEQRYNIKALLPNTLTQL